MKRTRWWQRYRKLGRIGRSVWFWTPDREFPPVRDMGTDVKHTNRWVWLGALEVCWLSREYMEEEGISTWR